MCSVIIYDVIYIYPRKKIIVKCKTVIIAHNYFYKCTGNICKNIRRYMQTLSLVPYYSYKIKMLI